MFYNKHGKKLSVKNIKAISKIVESKFGGKIPKGTSFKIGDDIFISLYDMLVVEDDLFALTSKLGQGAYGEVHKGKNLCNEKEVAIKCQKRQEGTEKQIMVTKCHGIGYKNSVLGPKHHNGYTYFILPLADMDLDKWIKTNIDWKKIMEIFIDICNDLERLHADGKVHMDLKPDNVLMVKDKAYISDFGKTEPIGKITPIIYDDFNKYPHTPPEYFITGSMGSQHYKVDPTFDSWSLGFIVKKYSKYFPYCLQSNLNHIFNSLQKPKAFRMSIGQAKNEFSNILLFHKNPWRKI